MKKIIGFTHPPAKVGGPSTFQIRLIEQLKVNGWQIVYPEDRLMPSVILVIGGTSKIAWLIKCKRNGARIVHRVAAIHWRYKVEKVSLKIYFLLIIQNLIVASIRKFLADFVIYQSQFAHDWWHRVRAHLKTNKKIIYNGTNLSLFEPDYYRKDSNQLNVICAEGNIPSDVFIPKLLRKVAKSKPNGKSINLTILGKVTQDIQEQLSDLLNVHFLGHVPRTQMFELLKTNDVFLSLEINAACPNSIVEALASGLPIIAFDTGATPELIRGLDLQLLEYDTDSWKLEPPTIEQNIDVILENLDKNLINLSKQCRIHAEKYLDAKMMAKHYIEVLEKQITHL